MLKVNDLVAAYDILKDYTGPNNYIKYLSVLNKENRLDQLNTMNVDYILKNKDFKPVRLDKVVGVTPWMGERLKNEFGLSFTPSRILIDGIVGETEHIYHIYMKYGQKQPKSKSYFMSKRGLMEVLLTSNYEHTEIDFNKYDQMLADRGKEGYRVLEHQKVAAKFLHTIRKGILADDQGLGKTMSTTIAALEGDYKKVLIVCPASLKTNWRNEIGMFIDVEENVKILESNKEYIDKRFTIINYDILEKFYKVPTEEYEVVEMNSKGEMVTKIKTKKSRKKNVIEESMKNSPLFQSKFDLIIIDEAHKLSNNTSGRYKAIEDLIKRSKMENIFILTGTPITNKPYNYYNILKLIDAEITRNWEEYVKTFCDGREIRLKTGKKIWLTSGSSNLEELSGKTKHLYLRRMKEDLELPPKEIIEIYYDLEEEQKDEYNKLWSDYELANQETDKTLNKELTEGIILRQYVSTEMVNKTINLTNSMIEKGKKVVIACSFENEIQLFKEYYGDKAVIYKGGMSIKQKDEAKRKFMEEPEVMVFIGNIIAAGVGLTLTVSHICVFNSFSWVPGDNLQMMDRVHRISQKHEVSIYFQLYRNTIYQEMWDKVMGKAMIIDSVIKDEKTKKTQLI